MANLRAVPDTNVIVAGHHPGGRMGPNREFLVRWSRGEFALLYSFDTLKEYIRKLLEMAVPHPEIVQFMAHLATLGEKVFITYFHLVRYPPDSDDTSFLLCAWNGGASHLVSYDHHLLGIAGAYTEHFRICDTHDFLHDLQVSAPN